jgi:hypothetical protein
MVVVARVRVTRARRRVCILDGTEEIDGACCVSGGDANCCRHLALLSVLEVKWDQKRSAMAWRGR